MSTKSIGTREVLAEIPSCLCEKVMCRKSAPPRMRYSSAREEFLMQCPTCGFKTHPDGNKQSVIAEWFGCNRSGDQHIESLWIERYERQQQDSAATRLSDACKSGTVVPL